MKRVVIVGHGFAGFTAARRLCGEENDLDVTVVDRHANTHYRPMLPDAVGGTIGAQYLLYPIPALQAQHGYHFVHGDVTAVDFEEHRVLLHEDSVPYDYLIYAAGSQTPLPPTDAFRRHALRVDSVHDANRVADMVASGSYERVVICGGGYTGVELASQVKHRLTRLRRVTPVTIVEMMDTILGPQPEWMQHYTAANLRLMGVEIMTGVQVSDIDESHARLSNGRTFDNVLLLWATGLRPYPLSRDWDVPTGDQHRIAAERDLRFKPDCFAAGDCACVRWGAHCTRMSLQLALSQGETAARNVIHLSRGEPTESYYGADPGYVIPMANGRSCGEVFGLRVRGYPATLLHYVLNAYRSYGMVNRFNALLALTRL
jgi:NADH:ubiquinone reductase (H+-translocating)